MSFTLRDPLGRWRARDGRLPRPARRIIVILSLLGPPFSGVLTMFPGLLLPAHTLANVLYPPGLIAFFWLMFAQGTLLQSPSDARTADDEEIHRLRWRAITLGLKTGIVLALLAAGYSTLAPRLNWYFPQNADTLNNGLVWLTTYALMVPYVYLAWSTPDLDPHTGRLPGRPATPA